MKFEAIMPFVRNVRLVNQKNFDYDNEEFVASYDSTMIYVLSGKGSIEFKNKKYELNRGCALVFGAGVFYKISLDDDFAYITVNFDYTKENSIAKSYPMLPEVKSRFKRSRVLPRVEFSDNVAFNDIVFAEEIVFIEERFLSMRTEFQRRESYYECKLSCELFSILVGVSRVIARPENHKFVREGDAGEIINFIHMHYNGELNNKEIGRRFNFSPKYINELVKSKTGYSLHKYVIVCRISKAINYLQNSDMSITEIGNEIGFADVSHFSKYFKQMIGVNPSMYRNKKNNFLR